MLKNRIYNFWHIMCIEQFANEKDAESIPFSLQKGACGCTLGVHGVRNGANFEKYQPAIFHMD